MARGRKPIGEKAMTAAERQRRRRQRLAQSKTGVAKGIVAPVHEAEVLAPLTDAVLESLRRREKREEARKWKDGLFRADDGNHYGYFWGRWRITNKRGDRWYRVYLTNGPRLIEFAKLACARRFCEAIEGLADWERPVAELAADEELERTLWRTAFKVGGYVQGRPLPKGL